MSPARTVLPQAFKRAVVISAFLHAGLLILIAASPSFTRSQPKALVQYVNFIGGEAEAGPAEARAEAPRAAESPPPRPNLSPHPRSRPCAT